MDLNTRKLAVVGSTVLIAILVARWVWKPRSEATQPQPAYEKAQQTAMTNGMAVPAGMTMPPGVKLPASINAAMGMILPPGLSMDAAEQNAMNTLVAEQHLSKRAAAYLVKSKIQLIEQTKTSLHFLMTFPDGGTINETVTLVPNQSYTPTAADLARAARLHKSIYDPRLKVEKKGDDSMLATLQYSVPASALPKELVQQIDPSAAEHRTAENKFFQIVPSANAQGRAIAEPSIGLVTNMLAEHWKAIDKVTLEELETAKSLGIDAPLAIFDLILSMKELYGQVSQIGDLQDCAENPTNPLTQKASKDPNYGHDVLDPLSEAKWNVGSSWLPRTANVGAGYLTHFLPYGAGFMLSPFLGMNDDAINSINEDRIRNAEQLVVACDKPIDLTPGAFRPMKGSFEYEFNLDDKTCLHEESQGGCSFHKEARTAEGKFSLNPDQFGFLVGGGSGTIQEQGEMHVDKTKAASKFTKLGTVTAEFKCGGDPQSGVVQMTIHGEGLTWDQQSTGPGGESLAHIHLNSGNFAVSCEFRNVDFTRSGGYSAFAQDDSHGTCKIEMERQ